MHWKKHSGCISEMHSLFAVVLAAALLTPTKILARAGYAVDLNAPQAVHLLVLRSPLYFFAQVVTDDMRAHAFNNLCQLNSQGADF